MDLRVSTRMIERCPSWNRAARILMLTEESEVMLLSPKDFGTIFSIHLADRACDILEMIYTRRGFMEGENWTATDTPDCAFLLTNRSYIVSVDFGELNNVSDPDSLILSDIDMGSCSFKTSTISIPKKVQFEFIVLVETPLHPNSLVGITENGAFVIFSPGGQYCGFRSDITRILSVIFSMTSQRLVVASVGRIYLFDIDKNEVVTSRDSQSSYTCLAMIGPRSVACGSWDGELDIRVLPSLSITSSNPKIAIDHPKARKQLTKKEKKQPTALKQFPFAIRSIDYCAPREAILTLSMIGELCLCTLAGSIIGHIAFPFVPSAACFLDGFGHVLISAFRTLLQIDWGTFFEEELESETTPLDHFDVLKEDFPVLPPSPRKKTRAPEEIKIPQPPYSRFARVPVEPDLMARRMSIIPPPQIEPFYDLRVEESAIPKRHHAPVEFIVERAPPRLRKCNFPRLGQAVTVPTIQRTRTPQAPAQGRKSAKRKRKA
jgi:hypothetical protein